MTTKHYIRIGIIVLAVIAAVVTWARFSSLQEENAELRGELATSKLEAAGFEQALAVKPREIIKRVTEYIDREVIKEITDAGAEPIIYVDTFTEPEVKVVTIPKEITKEVLPENLHIGVGQRAKIAMFTTPTGDVFWRGALFADLSIQEFGWAETYEGAAAGEVAVSDDMKEAIQAYYAPKRKFRFLPRGLKKMRFGWTVGPAVVYTGDDFDVGVGVMWGVQF